MASRALEITAYHEAGHAVAALTLELPLEGTITIVPDYATMTACCVSVPEAIGSSLTGLRQYASLTQAEWMALNLCDELLRRDRAERHALVFLAGGAAAARLGCRKPWRGARHDLDQVEMLLEGQAHLNTTSNEAEPYRRWLRARASTLVAANWHEIAAVAAALLREKELTSAQVAAIVEPAEGAA